MPPAGIAGAGFSSFLSATRLSVVRTIAATEKKLRIEDALAARPGVFLYSVYFVLSVKAVAYLAFTADSVDNNRAFKTCVSGNLTNRLFKSTENYLSTCLFVTLKGCDKSFYSGHSVDKCCTAACYDTFLCACLRTSLAVLRA